MLFYNRTTNSSIYTLTLTLTLLCGLFLPCTVNGQPGSLSAEPAAANPAALRRIAFTEAEQAWLAQGHVVRARVGTAPPLHFYESGSKGISVDYLNTVAQRAGFRVEYITGMPWDEALENLSARQRIDLDLTTQRTPERETFLAFTKTYIHAPCVIINRLDSPFIRNIEDLYGLTVAVEQSFVTQKLLAERYPEIALRVAGTTNDALKLLAVGEVNAYIGGLMVGTYLIRTHGLSNLKVAAPTPFDDIEQTMAVRGDWPELVAIIDKTLATFTPEEHSAILDRWLSPMYYEYNINSWDVFLWVAGISVVLLAIIYVVAYWNRKLAAEIVARRAAEEVNQGLMADLNRKNNELTRSQQLLTETGKIGKVGGWEFDIDTGNQRWTEEVHRIHEVSLDYESTVEKGTDFYTEASKPVIAAAVHRVSQLGEPFNLELEIITAKGNLRSVHAIGMADLGQRRVYGFFQDITAKKRIEKERERLIVQLLDKTEELERFVYTASHDLKSPLITISGFLNIIEQDHASGNDADFMSHLSMVANAAKRMKQLIDELLEISRIGSKRNPLVIVNLSLLIKEAIENLSGLISGSNATLEVASGLPDVMVDKPQLLQVIENLIANAVRYSRSQECAPVVNVGASRNDGEIICYIRDNGVGIEPKNLNRVFGLFERLDPNSDGTGVGLAIVKRIVEVHGGKVWAESEGLGQGTTFFFTLPAA